MEAHARGDTWATFWPAVAGDVVAALPDYVSAGGSFTGWWGWWRSATSMVSAPPATATCWTASAPLQGPCRS